MRRILPLFALVLALSWGAYLYASDGYTASYNTAVSITGPDSVCKRVTNANANSEYIPTASTAEWQSFYNHPPSGVSLNACTCSLPWGGTISQGQSVTAYAVPSVNSGASCSSYSQTRTCNNGTLSGSYNYASCSVSCSGVLYGGYCWYYSPASGSCDTACAGHGGCNLTGTAAYGSNGSLGMCIGLLSAMSAPGATYYDEQYSGNGGIGCSFSSYYGITWYREIQATTCWDTNAMMDGWLGSATYRACACNY